MLSFTKLFKQSASASDPQDVLCPWLSLITPELVQNKDGSIMAAFEYTGYDVEGYDQVEIDQVSQVFEQSSNAFRAGVTIWSVVDRSRTHDFPGGEFPSEVGNFINEAWREEFTSSRQLRNRYYLFVVLDAPKGSNAFLERLWWLKKNESMSFFSAFTEAVKGYFLRKNQFAFEQAQVDQQIVLIEDIVSTFIASATTLSLKRLEMEDYLGALFARCNPPHASANEHRPAYIPEYHLDSYLTSHTISRPNMKTLGFHGVQDAYCSALSIKSWPKADSMPGMLDGLLSIPGEIVISQAFRFTPKEESEAYIKTMQRYHDNAKKGVVQRMREKVSDAEGAEPDEGDQGRILLAQDAAEAQTEITALGRIYGYHNLTVLCYGETVDDAHQLVKEAYRALSDRNFVPILEEEGLQSAWAGTMPGQWGTIKRWLMVSNANLADMLPLRTIHEGSLTNKHFTEQRASDARVQGSPVAPALTVFPTRFSTPFFFNTHHVGDVGHLLVAGPTGAGKSIIVNFIISQFQKYQPSRTIIFDKNLSCRNATVLQDGTYVNVGASDPELGEAIKINPLQYIDEMSERAFLRDWLPLLMTKKGEEFSSEQLNEIWDALAKMSDSRDKNLRSLAAILPTQLSERLSDWIEGGPHAHYFDNNEDAFNLGQFTAFEMGRVFDNAKLAAAFLDYAFHRIEKSLDGTPTLIYLEEVKFLLDNEKFASRLDEWLRTFRKLNTFIIMATQGLKEIADSRLFSTIIDNVPNRIFLPNANALANEDLYRDKFGLNASQINSIRMAIPKRNYLIVQPGLTRMIDLPLPKEVISCLRSDTKANKVFNRHYAGRDKNPDWRIDFLSEVSA